MSLCIPPEWVVPANNDSHQIEAMISACLEGSVDKFEQLSNTSTSSLIPPAYLVRCAVKSRRLPMLQYILKRYALRTRTREWRCKHLTREDRVHLQYAIFLAIIQGDYAMMEQFLKNGVDLQPDAEHAKYWVIYSLLELAIREDQVEVARLLLQHGAKPSNGTRRLCFISGDCMALAAAIGSHDMLSLMLEYRGKVENSNLLWHVALGHCSIENAQTLLNLGANINEIFIMKHQDTAEGTALHAAATVFWMQDRSTEFAAWLLQNGTDYTVKDGHGRTAMQVAREYGHIQIESLIDDWIRDHTKQELSPRPLRSSKTRQSPLRQLETPKRMKAKEEEYSEVERPKKRKIGKEDHPK